jgi:cyclic beta-1,2-glucan synthetase
MDYKDYVIAGSPLPEELARSHQLTQKPSTGMLLKLLLESEAILIKTCQILGTTTTENYHLTPAAEWLLDNFYLIEEHIRIIKLNISKKYEKSLPQLMSGLLPGTYPRIYDIVLQIIEHGDGRWDVEKLSDFIQAYQFPLCCG